MAKMRVFEVARELNIPGRDLIKRMKGMGFTVKGNFDALDEEQIRQIKGSMLEPVTRVEEAAPQLEEGEDGEKPRKRRIISARRSKEVHKIQESLGMEGPLPEDAETRREVVTPPPAPEPAEEAPPVAAEEPAAAEAGEAPPGAEEAPPPEAEEVPPVAAEAPAEPVPPPRRPGSPRATVVAMPDEAPGAKPEPPSDRRPAPAAPSEDRGKWREFKRSERKPDQAGREDWIRSPRRRGGRMRRHRPAKVAAAAAAEALPIPVRKRKIRLGQVVTVSELAGATGVKAGEIIKKLMALGILATINQPIEGSVAELVAAEFEIEVEADTSNLEDLVKEEPVDPATLFPRPPIVTVMGHVDHGKTSLLDRIRNSDVTAREAGGITQHIGAYFVHSPSGDLVFLDTPGHEAFTSLRARGANVTDLVVLVVAADDGVMPQTVEAIEHSHAAKVPIMVAINKMDRPNADPEKVKRQLMEHDLLPEELGGDTVFVPVSAATGDGIPQLLEMIHLQGELLELKAPRVGLARGFVIESKMDRQRGPVATVIVQRGTIKVGDEFVVGATHGRVRAMFDDNDDPVTEAPPSTPVEILGYNDLPQAGDLFVVMDDEKVIRQIAERRGQRAKETEAAQRHRVHLEDFLQGVKEGESTSLNVVLKADTQGSLEAIRGSLEKIGNEQVNVNHVRAGIGGITETDISLASTTDSIVIGFNVRPDAKAASLAQSDGIEIKLYAIIYELINDVKAGLQGLLKPVIREQVIGHLEVREVFSSPKDGKIVGGYVTDGRLQRNSFVRLFRDDVLVTNGTIGSLRRFKEDVQDVQSGYECGLRIANVTDIREGDLIEAFVKVEEAQTLESLAQN